MPAGFLGVSMRHLSLLKNLQITAAPLAGTDAPQGDTALQSPAGLVTVTPARRPEGTVLCPALFCPFAAFTGISVPGWGLAPSRPWQEDRQVRGWPGWVERGDVPVGDVAGYESRVRAGGLGMQWL